MQYFGYRSDASRYGASEWLDQAMVEEARRRGLWLDLGTSMEPGTGELKPLPPTTKEDSGARMILHETYEWEP